MHTFGREFDQPHLILSTEKRALLQMTKTSQQPTIRRCTHPDCDKKVRSKGLCKAHGGGLRCLVEGCNRSSQGKGYCIRHGGGKRCSISGCNRSSQSNGLCKSHGGGLRCQVPHCNKSSQGGGYCRLHGGGYRCQHPQCDKGAQRGGYCASHGGNRACQYPDCKKNDRGGGYCAEHGGGRRCAVHDCDKPARKQGMCSQHAVTYHSSTPMALDVTVAPTMLPFNDNRREYLQHQPVAREYATPQYNDSYLKHEPVRMELMSVIDHHHLPQPHSAHHQPEPIYSARYDLPPAYSYPMPTSQSYSYPMSAFPTTTQDMVLPDPLPYPYQENNHQMHHTSHYSTTPVPLTRQYCESTTYSHQPHQSNLTYSHENDPQDRMMYNY